jgi:GNAT superfamily N-acetyltransferase
MRVTRTCFELREPGQFRPAVRDFPDVALGHVATPPPALYRECYRTVGEAYGWRDRWDWSDDEIMAHLADLGITLFIVRRGGALAGYYELRGVKDDGSVEVAYLGLAPAEVGRGYGKHLLSCAVRDAWALRPSRVWLHTSNSITSTRCRTTCRAALSLISRKSTR